MFLFESVFVVFCLFLALSIKYPRVNIVHKTLENPVTWFQLQLHVFRCVER